MADRPMKIPKPVFDGRDGGAKIARIAGSVPTRRPAK